MEANKEIPLTEEQQQRLIDVRELQALLEDGIEIPPEFPPAENAGLVSPIPLCSPTPEEIQQLQQQFLQSSMENQHQGRTLSPPGYLHRTRSPSPTDEDSRWRDPLQSGGASRLAYMGQTSNATPTPATSTLFTAINRVEGSDGNTLGQLVKLGQQLVQQYGDDEKAWPFILKYIGTAPRYLLEGMYADLVVSNPDADQGPLDCWSLDDLQTVLKALMNTSSTMSSNGQDLPGSVQKLLEAAGLEDSCGFPFSQKWLQTWAKVRAMMDDARKASGSTLSADEHRILIGSLHAKCVADAKSSDPVGFETSEAGKALMKMKIANIKTVEAYLMHMSQLLSATAREVDSLLLKGVKVIWPTRGNKRPRGGNHNSTHTGGGQHQTGGSGPPREDQRSKPGGKASGNPPPDLQQPDAPPGTKIKCYGCGREGHRREACGYTLGKYGIHPDLNREDKPWAESAKGLARKNHATTPSEVLLGKERLDGTQPPANHYGAQPSANNNGAQPSANGNKRFSECIHTLTHPTSVAETPEPATSPPLVCSPCGPQACPVSVSEQSPHVITGHGYTLTCGINITDHDTPASYRKINTLVDTGAISANYISPDTAAWLRVRGAEITRVRGADMCTVCSITECTVVDTIVTFKLEYLNRNTNDMETNVAKAWVLPGCPYDMIMGRPFIEQHRLLEDGKIHLSGDEYSFKYDTRQGMIYHVRHTTQDEIDPDTAETRTIPIVINQNPQRLFNIRQQGGTSEGTIPKHSAHLTAAAADSTPTRPRTPKRTMPGSGKKSPVDKTRKTAQSGPFLPPLVCEAVVKRLRELAEREIQLAVQAIEKGIKEKDLLRAAPLDDLATPPGPNSSVIAPLQYLYFLRQPDSQFLQKEFCVDSKYTVEQYLYHSYGEQVMTRESKDNFIDPIDDDDEIDYSKDNIPWEDDTKLYDFTYKPFKFPENVDVQQQKALREILEQYDSVFQPTLNKEPALLEPMVLKVNDEKWRVPRNRTAARFMSELKRVEIKAQVDKMLALGLIRPSQSAEKSQVVLAKKPDGSWRFCIDYRELNTHTESMGWPVPNINQMIQRIGSHKPKLFAVMDLTMGFFQAPLAEQSSKYTTFTTWMGTYEWKRVAMGLKGAPSWFQQQLETTVLGGLIHVTCELYIDDLVIWASTYEEYVTRLEEILERFKRHNITVNPKKCQFLMTEIEYVGHVLNEKGIAMTEERKAHVLQIPVPSTQGELKSFLGMANYFRMHVRHYESMQTPLDELLQGYKKRKRGTPLVMDPEHVSAFQRLQLAINECPMLHFPRTDLEIFLETDASDYGVGGYVYQKDHDGTQLPIACLSKKLAGAQLNWSVPEKEAYGIFFSLQKLEYLLRDVHFVMRTDHKNLTYINFGQSAKIMRWKLFVQEYDFDIEYIKGENNVVADAFSRLLVREEEDPAVKHLLATIRPEWTTSHHIPNERYKIISEIHNTNNGHFGVQITLDKLPQKWDGARKDVTAFIKRCPCCQVMSVLKDPILHHPFKLASFEPLEKLQIDTIGPFDPDGYNNKYVIVIVDCFSRYAMLVPAKDASAMSAARAILQWMGVFPKTPHEIQSDMGTQFINDIIDGLLKLLGVQKLDILAGIHELNGIVERRNKEINRHLRNILFERNIKPMWSDACPLVQRIINSQRMQPIGTSPAQIIFGNNATADTGVLLVAPTGQGPKRLSEWTAKMLKVQTDIIATAQRIQGKEFEEYFERFQGSVPTTFSVNSYVLAGYDDRSPPSKLHPKWRGPYRVVNQDKDEPNRYTVQDLVTLKLYDFDVKNLKTFHESDAVDPRTVAMAGSSHLHDLEEIITHEGEITKPNQLKFQVRYADGDISWDSYGKLKGNQILHDYLTKTGGRWESLIPMEFTHEGEHYSERNPKRSRPVCTKKVRFEEPERKSSRIRKEPAKG